MLRPTDGRDRRAPDGRPEARVAGRRRLWRHARPKERWNAPFIAPGDTPAWEYVYERTADLVVHMWDLARAIGADERLDPELVQACRALYALKGELWRASGVLGPPVVPPPGATPRHLGGAARVSAVLRPGPRWNSLSKWSNHKET